MRTSDERIDEDTDEERDASPDGLFLSWSLLHGMSLGLILLRVFQTSFGALPSEAALEFVRQDIGR